MSNDDIVQIAKEIAADNGVDLRTAVVLPGFLGDETLEISLMLAETALGRSTAMTTSQIVRRLADSGDDRRPIVRFI
jgi:hypothetical protein